MQNEKLGVAIHGAGWVAGAHAASWLKNPHARIVSISDAHRDRAEQLAGRLGLQCAVRDDYEAVLCDDRVDVVDLCGPSHVHAEQGIAAAQAGKHVLVEKPIALTMEENRALRDAIARAGVKSLAGFVLRWNPAVQCIKSLVSSGAIGRLFYVEIDYWHGLGPTHHAWNLHSRKKTGGSAMLLGGCHAVDAMRWLSGDEVVEVTATANNPKGLFEYDANVVAAMKFAGGTIGKTSALFDCEMPYSLNIDLAGAEGTIRDNRLWSKRLFPGQTGWTTIPTTWPTTADVSHHPFDAEINHFVECMREGRESHCNVADAYRTHELCLAIDRSMAEGGRPVRLPLE
jgi:predicted dehydrogenase